LSPKFGRVGAFVQGFHFCPRRALSDDMSKRPAKVDAAPALTIPERLLLFCVASGTDWEHAGVTGATVTAMVVRGVIERDAGGRLRLTPQGRAALDALLAD
jgi:hypothetical protein